MQVSNHYPFYRKSRRFVKPRSGDWFEISEPHGHDPWQSVFGMPSQFASKFQIVQRAEQRVKPD
jgi:hypothetical protein